MRRRDKANGTKRRGAGLPDRLHRGRTTGSALPPLAYTLPVVAALLLAGCALDTEDPCGRLLHSGNVSSWASDVTNMGGDIKAGSVECWCDERRRTTCLYTDHRRCQRDRKSVV